VYRQTMMLLKCEKGVWHGKNWTFWKKCEANRIFESFWARIKG
jgi:hypothetical protein